MKSCYGRSRVAKGKKQWTPISIRKITRKRTSIAYPPFDGGKVSESTSQLTRKSDFDSSLAGHEAKRNMKRNAQYVNRLQWDVIRASVSRLRFMPWFSPLSRPSSEQTGANVAAVIKGWKSVNSLSLDTHFPLTFACTWAKWKEKCNKFPLRGGWPPRNFHRLAFTSISHPAKLIINFAQLSAFN